MSLMLASSQVRDCVTMLSSLSPAPAPEPCELVLMMDSGSGLSLSSLLAPVSSLCHLSPITNHSQCLRCCKMAAPGSPGQSSVSALPRLGPLQLRQWPPPPTQAASGTQSYTRIWHLAVHFLGDLVNIDNNRKKIPGFFSSNHPSPLSVPPLATLGDPWLSFFNALWRWREVKTEHYITHVNIDNCRIPDS